MATSSILTEKQQSLVKPDEDIMFDRESFDRSGVRTEFAPIQALDPTERYVEQGDAMFVHPESDYPTGDSTVGEVVGNLDLVRAVGENQYIPRYTHGFHLDTEDVTDGNLSDADVQAMRDAIIELFDIRADYAFLQGLERPNGDSIHQGVFEWLDGQMPADNIIDCSDYDPSAGDLQGVPANIIKRVAYSQVTGEYVQGQWDLCVAKHPVWSRWNELGTFDGATVESQWMMVDASDDAEVGVNRRIRLPNFMGMRAPPSMDESLQLDIDYPARQNQGYDSPISEEGDYEDRDDVMYLIPNHGGDFYELYEQDSPDHRMLEKEGWKERHEYKWRAGVVQGQTHKRASPIAEDAIKLENVTALFE